MKILFFSKLFYPHIGGVEKHVEEISKILIKKGHEITVLTEKFDKSWQDNEIINGIKIIRIDNGKDDWFKKFRVWANVWNNRKLIIGTDIIHAHDVFFWFLPFKVVWPYRKVFVTFHGYEGNKIPSLKAKLMHKIAEKLSHGNICVGDFLKKWYGTKPTYVVYGAVDSNLIEQGRRLGKASKDAVFLGRLENETGIIEYLKAVMMLNINKVNLSLDVFGNGTLEKEAKKFALKNKLKINFKGFIPNATDYLKDYKYVFTSRYLGILEAIALKKPVFAEYNNDIKKDYLEMAPFADFISISKNGEEISKNINDFMNGTSELVVEKAYDWVKVQTWDKMTEIYLKLWSESFI